MTNLTTRFAALAFTAIFSATMILGAVAPAQVGISPNPAAMRVIA